MERIFYSRNQKKQIYIKPSNNAPNAIKTNDFNINVLMAEGTKKRQMGKYRRLCHDYKGRYKNTDAAIYTKQHIFSQQYNLM